MKIVVCVKQISNPHRELMKKPISFLVCQAESLMNKQLKLPQNTEQPY